MSLFSELMGKVFGSREEAEGDSTAKQESPPSNPEGGQAVPAEGVEEGPDSTTPDPAAKPEVDVEAMLDEMEAKHPDNLDWKLSIVDLLKLLGLDSSYAGRKEMAIELGYGPEEIDARGSAEMNIWLHRQVMRKIAENGGQIPGELLP